MSAPGTSIVVTRCGHCPLLPSFPLVHIMTDIHDLLYFFLNWSSGTSVGYFSMTFVKCTEIFVFALIKKSRAPEKLEFGS